ncbi:hypothetical protein DO97_12150 [Neosynechococcus sphagnicola sy1]|uniref:Uncharacterized protein n=1 Tax=Neosynechococcus sphagnicola sy1 TaxID=1497020 RepID=A0A098TJ69_9CYAN|nr:hypothetical protein DO97_12150 [Neosynechococcus sphagnicola sy1]
MLILRFAKNMLKVSKYWLESSFINHGIKAFEIMSRQMINLYQYGGYSTSELQSILDWQKLQDWKRTAFSQEPLYICESKIMNSNTSMGIHR